MTHPYDEPTIPYRSGQDQTQAAMHNNPAADTSPAEMSTPPSYTFDTAGAFAPRPPEAKRPSRGLRTGAIIALTLLLAIIFGTGLFAGWEYGRGTPVVDRPNTGLLQPGATSQVTVPPLTGTNTETVREAVIAKVR